MFDFYIGGYARPDQPGIRRFSLNDRTGVILPGAAFEGLENPSWLLRHPEKPVLYAVEELNPDGRIVALAETDGGLRQVCALPSGGADPCHLALSPDGRFLFCANYSSGSLSVFALDARGIPTGMSDHRQHVLPAPGGNPGRQEAAHVHFSLCDGRHVYVNDLGMNRTLICDWDGEAGRLGAVARELTFPAGEGPRHLAMAADGRFLYVLCELTGAVHAFAREAEGWREIQSASALPEGFDGFADCNCAVGAAIRVADGRLYASCRGSHTVAAFDIAADGTLSGRRVAASGGRTPRDIQTVGSWLLAANQDSDVVTLFRRDAEAGLIPFGEALPAVKPSCICLVPSRQGGASGNLKITWKL